MYIQDVGYKMQILNLQYRLSIEKHATARLLFRNGVENFTAIVSEGGGEYRVTRRIRSVTRTKYKKLHYN